jgi:hypothetical protein
LLDARLRGAKYFITSSDEGAGTAFNFVGVVSESLSMFIEQSGVAKSAELGWPWGLGVARRPAENMEE